MDKFQEGVIDLSQFRKKKEEQEKMVEPIFTDPTLITLGDPNDPDHQIEYLLLVNLVIHEKQFLALESMEKEDRGTIAIVEAIVEDGQFVGVQAIATDEEYEELSGIMTEALSTQAEEDFHDSND